MLIAIVPRIIGIRVEKGRLGGGRSLAGARSSCY